MVLTKEAKAIYMKEWRNKKISEDPEYYKKKNLKYREYNQTYYASPRGIKSTLLSAWKGYGLVHDDYEILYKKYINTTQCDVCDKQFKNSFDRCMDHDHATGLFRQVLCRNCNIQDRWKNYLK